MAGDDVRIVVGMDEHAVGVCECALVRDRRVGRRQIDRRAVAACRLDLAGIDALPHRDEAVDVVLRRRPRDRLRVVAGRPRDDAAPALVGRERGDAVQRAARLEGAGLLEQLRLQVRAERRRRERRGAVDTPGDRAPGPLDVDHTSTVSDTETGSRTVNAVRRSGSLATSTRPPIASVNSFTIARPSPVPTGRSRP